MYIIAWTQKNRPKLFTETFGIDYTIFEKKNSVFLCSSKNWKKTCPESFIDIKYNIFTDELSKKNPDKHHCASNGAQKTKKNRASEV